LLDGFLGELFGSSSINHALETRNHYKNALKQLSEILYLMIAIMVSKCVTILAQLAQSSWTKVAVNSYFLI
jgi:hypothetical protein